MPQPLLHASRVPARAATRPHRWGRRILAVLLAVLVITLGTIAFGTARLTSQLTTVELPGSGGTDPAPIRGYPGAFDVLLVGSDGRAGQGAQYGEGGTITGARNDVTLLLHVNATHDVATLVSFPRDLLIDFPACTAPNGATVPAATGVAFGSGLGRGGLGCVATAVQSLTGTPIRYAAEISFQGVIDLSTVLGGVPVCFTGPIDDPRSGLVIPSAGTFELSGEQALALLRSRHGVGDGSDLARISSQQVFLSALARTLRDRATLTDPVRLYAIADAVSRTMTLSTDLADPGTLTSLATTFAGIPLETTALVTYPYLPHGNRVVSDREAARQLFALIAADTPVHLDPARAGRGATASATPTPDRTPVRAQPSTTASPSAAPDPGQATASTASLPTNLDGQNADRATCIVPA